MQNTGRVEKFSFSADELRAVEAAIELVVVEDVLRLFREKEREVAKARLTLLQRRRKEHGRPKRARTERATKKLASQLQAVARSTFAQASPLKVALALVEVLTARPYDRYAGADDVPKLSDKMRSRSALAVVHGTDDPERWIVLARDALRNAGDVHSTFWRKFGWAMVVGLIAVTAGVFAAPFVGALVGGWLGLSGAAAVSAGLAALGGGAMAAGGFGMVGGTVLVATAFGAAGGGASLFLAKDGDVAARLAAIKTQATFGLLTELGLMDHVLAGDFISTFESLFEEYQAHSSSNAAKVADVFRAGLSAVRDEYGKAAAKGRVSNEPLAWTAEAADADSPATGPEDELTELAQSLTEALATLERCAEFLRHAHSSYAEVKDKGWFKGLWGHLTGESRRLLVAGHASLSAATEEITNLVVIASKQFEKAAAVAARLERADLALLEMTERVERYRALLIAIHRQNDQLKSSLAAALAAALLLRTASGDGPLCLPAAGAAGPEANRDDCDDARLDGYLAVHFAPRSSAVQVARQADKELLTAREIGEVLEVLGVPLGAPMSNVTTAYRDCMKELHADKNLEAGERRLRALRKEEERARLAKRLHERYHVLLEAA